MTGQFYRDYYDYNGRFHKVEDDESSTDVLTLAQLWSKDWWDPQQGRAYRVVGDSNGQ